ncbi:MAG: hypothetical protein K6G26_09860 [Lachnospiraceae bacterium]|nr:hypothetical protein [Lachnospiraceae bacterium]
MIVSSDNIVKFYKKLGFKEIYRRDREYDSIVLLEEKGVEIEFFIDDRHAKKKDEPLGLRHIAFQVDNIESTIGELGLEDGHIITDWIGRRYCNITDPEGNVIELHE